jgi:hypothetical protein
MSGRSPETEPPGPSAVVPAVLAATFLVVVLATWAAAIGPDRVFRDDPSPRETSSQEPADRPEPNESKRGEADEEDEEKGWGNAAILGVEIALLVVVAYLAALLVRWVRSEAKEERRRRRRREVDFEVLPASPELAVEEMVRDADRQLALLREGTPRNGIVACWHRFEVQAEAAGIGREPWETSAEFTLRVLDLVSADARAVAELSVLYREARFSDHDLGESARSAALSALERIHRGLGARLAQGPA